MEEVLQVIHKEFISNTKEGEKQRKQILRETLEKIVKYMSEEDKIFKQVYKSFYFCHNDNLKVKRIYEFDVYFLLELPKKCEAETCSCLTIESRKKPGFLTLKFQENCCPTVYQKFCHNEYLQTNLIFDWIKILVNKALDRITVEEEIISFSVESDQEVKQGTRKLQICINKKPESIYFDLTAALKLPQNYWPEGYKKHKEVTTKRKYFFIVPVSAGGDNRYWIPSFQPQERDIILHKQRLKPALRILKLIRTAFNQKVSNYMLKTLILEEADEYEWKDKSFKDTFMFLFQKYMECLHREQLTYFWMDNLNLFEGLEKETIQKYCKEINTAYQTIQQGYSTNPCVVAEVILKKNSGDYKKFIEIWNSQEKSREKRNKKI